MTAEQFLLFCTDESRSVCYLSQVKDGLAKLNAILASGQISLPRSFYKRRFVMRKPLLVRKCKRSAVRYCMKCYIPHNMIRIVTGLKMLDWQDEHPKDHLSDLYVIYRGKRHLYTAADFRDDMIKLKHYIYKGLEIRPAAVQTQLF